MEWKRKKFVCSECGKEAWIEIDIESYVVKTSDLICDDCNPTEDEH